MFSLLDTIKNHLVLRVAIWIIGEYSVSANEIDQAYITIKTNIGNLPIFEVKKEDEEAKGDSHDNKAGPQMITKTIIMPDGSYGTETIYVDDPNAVNTQLTEELHPLRKCLINAEDDFLASCVAISLTKLTVKCKKNL
jgi:coatomer subunit beta